MVKFEDPDVDARFEACREKDVHIHVPAGKEKKGGFAGPLSKITEAAAEKAIASGSNILKLKRVEAKGAAKPSSNGSSLT